MLASGNGHHTSSVLQVSQLPTSTSKRPFNLLHPSPFTRAATSDSRAQATRRWGACQWSGWPRCKHAVGWQITAAGQGNVQQATLPGLALKCAMLHASEQGSVGHVSRCTESAAAAGCGCLGLSLLNPGSWRAQGCGCSHELETGLETERVTGQVTGCNNREGGQQQRHSSTPQPSSARPHAV